MDLVDRALTRAFVCECANDIDSPDRLKGLTREKNDIRRRRKHPPLGPMDRFSVVKNSRKRRVSGDTSWMVKKKKKKFEMEMRMEAGFSPSFSETVRRIRDAVFVTTGIFHRFSFRCLRLV